MTNHWERPEQPGPAKIALIDDNTADAPDCANGLRRLGHSVAHFEDANQARQSFEKVLPDLALIKIGMKGLDAYALLAALHKKGQVPVIFISEEQNEAEHVRALRSGADDFLVKPVSLRMLNVRISVLLRRRGPQPVSKEHDPWQLARGALEMAPELHAARWNGINLRLTATEFTILQALAEKPGFVRSRGYLKTLAYGDSSMVNDRTIDSHIKRLRAKLRHICGDNLPIDTVYGLGYRFRIKEKAEGVAA